MGNVYQLRTHFADDLIFVRIFLFTIHDLSHKHFPDFHTADNIAQAEKGMQQIIKEDAHIIFLHCGIYHSSVSLIVVVLYLHLVFFGHTYGSLNLLLNRLPMSLLQ